MTLAERLIERGELEGELQGKREGELEGEIREKQHILLRLLEKKFGGLDRAEKDKVMHVRDGDRLDLAIDRLLDAKSIDDVLQPLDKKPIA